MFKQRLNGDWQFCQAGNEDWLPATVPGGVHTDLLALGKIPEPFVADNELVELSIDGADTVFSDNYFDLPAGVAVTVTCPLPADWTAASKVNATSLSDSFA